MSLNKYAFRLEYAEDLNSVIRLKTVEASSFEKAIYNLLMDRESDFILTRKDKVFFENDSTPLSWEVLSQVMELLSPYRPLPLPTFDFLRPTRWQRFKTWIRNFRRR